MALLDFLLFLIYGDLVFLMFLHEGLLQLLLYTFGLWYLNGCFQGWDSNM